MNRPLTRRAFLEASGFAACALAMMGLIGCSGEQGGGTSSAASSASTAASASTSSTAINSSSSSSVEASTGGDVSTGGAGNAAVVFFSCTGNTEAVADKIAEAVSITPMEIVAAVPYTSDDLNYNADCRANAEQNEGTARPALAQPIPDVANADVIYLGYPIWWGKAPRIVLTFLEQANVAGKTVVPFCTSGGSGIEGSLSEIEAAAAGATVEGGRRFTSSVSQADIDAWIADVA